MENDADRLFELCVKMYFLILCDLGDIVEIVGLVSQLDLIAFSDIFIPAIKFSARFGRII